MSEKNDKRQIKTWEEAQALLQAAKYEEYIDYLQGCEITMEQAKPLAFAFSEIAGAAYDRAIALQGQAAIDALNKAVIHLVVADFLWPDCSTFQCNSGIIHYELAGLLTGSEVRRHQVAAKLAFEEAVESDPENHQASCWLGMLEVLIALEDGPPSDLAAVERALERFEKLHLKGWDSPNFHNFWGYACGRIVDELDLTDVERLLTPLAEAYDDALATNPAYCRAIGKWGLKFARLADRAAPSDAPAHLRDAITKYEIALRHADEREKLLYNLGHALTSLAELSEPDQAGELFDRALRVFTDLRDSGGDVAEAEQAIGYVHYQQARRSSGGTARNHFLAAMAANERILALVPSSDKAHYNIACISARLGDGAGCEAHLRIAVRLRPERSRSEVLADDDFDSVRNEPWFAAIFPVGAGKSE